MANVFGTKDQPVQPLKLVIVVCGGWCETIIRGIIQSHLDFDLEIVSAHNKELLLDALASIKPVLCVSEFYVITSKAFYNIISAPEGWGWHGRSAAMGTGGTPIIEMFDELKAASPQTAFVVACHSKLSNETKTHEAELKKHPEIIKTMGFMNSRASLRYLAKLFTKTFTGRTWHGTIGGKTE
jgi:hypothetical protein